MLSNSNSTSRAVERALDILEEVSGERAGLTHAQLSRQLGIPKSTASYLLHALELRGYLQREPVSGRYSLGLQVLKLSHAVSAQLDLRTLALPYMREFVAQTALSSHLAILDRGRAVYIEKVEGSGFVRMDTWVGKRIPMHTTAVGKVLAAWLPDEQIKGLLAERGMERQTPETIITPTRYLGEIERVRQRYYALDREENSLGVWCVSAPVFNAEGKLLAAFGTSGTTAQIDEARLAAIVPHVKETAHKISRELGFNGTFPTHLE